ncbi:DUF4282 domain-containing protein [Timonella sp. A28]|uniref:DUF4282 domain-containing protein n=1 Tax=Timonella sp. A28 TaxID=3442640 RepID=UPI003EBD2073
MSQSYPEPETTTQPAPETSPIQSYDPNPPRNTQDSQGVSFFKALFDLSFSHFVTLKFAKFIYVLLLIFVGLSYLIAFFALAGISPLYGFLALFLGAIVSAVHIILLRIGLEFAVAMIRTAENTTTLAKR